MNSEALQEFLAELTLLSQKHKLRIGGCGCCGSPWVEPLTEPKVYVAHESDLLDEGYPVSIFMRTVQ